MLLVYILIVIAAYFIGSIPFAYIFVRRDKHFDIRDFGSGNVGSTNTLRAAGWRTAVPVFICDVLKGFIPVLAAQLLGGDLLALCAGLAAFFGHIYPVWLNFRGGKGVATALGIALALVPQLTWVALLTWLLALVVTGYVSVASCLAALSVFIACLFTRQPWLITLLTAIVSTVITVCHRSNFHNIAAGSEVKMLRRKK